MPPNADNPGERHATQAESGQADRDRDPPTQELPDSGSSDADLFQPPEHEASPLNRWSHAVVGVVLIILGVILAILPIVPGFPLIAIGVLMLAAASEPSRRFLNRTEHRFPGWVRRLLRRVVGQRGTHSGR